MNAFDRLGFTEAEADALVAAARAAYAAGAQVPSPAHSRLSKPLDKAQKAAQRLLKWLGRDDALTAPARRAWTATRQALVDVPDPVAEAVRWAWRPGSGEYAYLEGDDPITVLGDMSGDLGALRQAAAELAGFELVIETADLDTLMPLGRPKARDFRTNRFIAVVARAYREKTGLAPTLSVDAYADAPSRGGGFADLLRAVAVRSQLGLDPDVVLRKASHLRERGSI
jgi:hypothetical protein